MPQARRDHKDTLFRKLFSEPDSALELYRAVSGSDTVDADGLEIVTLEDALYLSYKNDVAVLARDELARDELALFEHQSTVNPNMPLRGLLYFAREYDGLLARARTRAKGGAGPVPSLYGGKPLTIPAPLYVVFYNGADGQPDRMDLHLSDAFGRPAEGYEWTARVLNINKGRNARLMAACRTLRDYAELVAAIRERLAAGAFTQEAVDGAVDDCIRRGVLAEYLAKHGAEVKGMLLAEYDRELHERMMRSESYDDGYERGLEQGRAQGVEQGMAKGVEKGEDRLGNLIRLLIGAGRDGDVARAATDRQYRDRLYAEFGI